MTPEEAAAEMLRREAASPGSFPAAAVAKARGLAGSEPGKETLPEVTIEADKPSKFVEYGSRFAKATEPIGNYLVHSLDTALLGLPKRLLRGTDVGKGLDAVSERNPASGMAGDVAGNLGSVANLAGAGAGSALEGAIPQLGKTIAGRTLSGGVQGAAAGAAAGAGTAAVRGDTAGEVAQEGLSGAAVGSAAGAGAHLVLGEGARALKGLVRSSVPELATAEAGGASTSTATGISPGPEMQGIRAEAKAAGTGDVAYQSSKLTGPLTESANAELKAATEKIHADVERFNASPEGQKRVPVDKILKAYTDEVGRNISAESGAPVAGADLGELRSNIKNLADLQLVTPSQSDAAMARPGAMRLSLDEAARRGFDVEGAARAQLQNPEAARFMDVIVIPRRYNSEETLQAIDNIKQMVDMGKRRGGPQVSDKLLAGAMSQRDSFAGLPELRAGHEELMRSVKDPAEMAGIPLKSEQYQNANDEKTTFNVLSNYGDKTRLPAIDEALRTEAGRADLRNAQPGMAGPANPAEVLPRPSAQGMRDSAASAGEPTPEQAAAIRKFTFSPGEKPTPEEIAHVNAYIAATPPKPNQTVFRGLSLSPDQVKGLLEEPTLSMQDRPTSVSSDPIVARSFSERNKRPGDVGVTLKLNTSSARGISSLAEDRVGVEKELLLPGKTQFQITKRYEDASRPGDYIIEATEFNPADVQTGPTRRSLDMVAALKALKMVEQQSSLGNLLPIGMGPSGNIGPRFRAPMTAVGLRADPILDMLLRPGAAAGTIAARRRGGVDPWDR